MKNSNQNATLYTMLLTQDVSLPELYLKEKAAHDEVKAKYDTLIHMVKLQGCDKAHQKIQDLITNNKTIH